MGVRAAVVGASGYAGGELVRLVDAHPDLEVGPLLAAGNAGRRLREVHPQLVAVAHRPLLSLTADDGAAALRGADFVFLALPHGASAEVVAGLPGDVPIVDLG